MIRRKKIQMVIGILLFLLTANICVSSIFALKPNEEKYLANARIITYTKKGDPNRLYALIEGKEIEVKEGEDVSFEHLYNLVETGRVPKRYRVVSVEPYNGENFRFGSSVYDYTKVYESDYQKEFFAAQEKFVENKVDFDDNYAKYAASAISLSDSKLNSEGVSSKISVSLNGGYDYSGAIKEKRNRISYLKQLLGGSNMDRDAHKVISSLSTMKESELKKQRGKLYFIPYVITLERIQNVNVSIDGYRIRGFDAIDPDTGKEIRMQTHKVSVSLSGIDEANNVIIRDNFGKERVIERLTKEHGYSFEEDFKGDTILEVNPDRNNPSFETTYEDNQYNIDSRKMDLAVVKIHAEKKYPPNADVMIPVEVYVIDRKNSRYWFETTDIHLNEKSKIQSVEGKDFVFFQVRTPAKGCMKLTAEINKSRKVVETNYENNKKTTTICVDKDIEIKPSEGCPDAVTWKERDVRMEDFKYKVCDSYGTCEEKVIKVPKYYDFVYEAKLHSTLTLKDDKAQQINRVVTKAGYGIMANVKSEVKWKQISGKWQREPNIKPTNATQAILKTSWKVKKIHNQPQTMYLQQQSKGQFVTPSNASSKKGKSVIYTDVDMADGMYEVEVNVSGAKAGGQSMCNTIKGEIKIKGDMYEDYKVN